jgi:predicted ArsR family transcriptional regulator
LAAVLAEPGGITTRRLAEKLATVPYQIRPNLSKLVAHGQITKTVISPRGDAMWSPAVSPEFAGCILPDA